MKRLILLIAAFSAAGCAGTYKTTFDHEAAAEPINLHVVPVVPKEEMDVQIVVSDSSGATAQYGLIGGLVGAIIDSAVNKKRAIEAERKAEVLREANAEYDIFAAAHRTTLRVGDNALWDILAVEEPVSSAGWDDLANNAFESGGAEAVLVLVFDHALTPAANQVRIKVNQNVYLRSDPKKGTRNRKPKSSRSFTYLSPIEQLDFRPFEDGEKEKIVQTIRDDYAERMAAHPDEKDDLEKAMEKELEEISGSSVIPQTLAMREAWSSDLLARYLDQSIDHIAWMLRHDWETSSVPEEAQRTADSFPITADTGMVYRDKGQNVGQIDANTIYRSQRGDMYSIPTAQ